MADERGTELVCDRSLTLVNAMKFIYFARNAKRPGQEETTGDGDVYVCSTGEHVDVLKAVESSQNLRSFVEGERVLDAGHVFVCGKKLEDEEQIVVFALCLATSALKGEPHRVTVKLRKCDLPSGNVSVSEAHCSCKAGLSECCKHIVAVLLHCNRTGVSNLETLSCTDLECGWSRRSSRITYDKPAPLGDFCHVAQTSPPFLLAADDAMKLRTEFMELCPESQLAKHSKRQRREVPNSVPEAHSSLFEQVNSLSSSSCMLKKLAQEEVFNINTSCEDFYACNVVVTPNDAQRLLAATQTNKAVWMEERRKRITGTTCYPLYTYSKKEWEKKVWTTLNPSFKGNEATRYGSRMEPLARQKYVKDTGNIVVTCGLLVCVENPWLGCSPDGVVMLDDAPSRLLEIKSPKEGKTMTAKETAETCKYLEKDGEAYRLKKKHTYYGQVQLGMTLLNVKSCDFVVYASFDNSLETINVPYDEDFTWGMLKRLKTVYFKHVLPVLTSANIH